LRSRIGKRIQNLCLAQRRLIPANPGGSRDTARQHHIGHGSQARFVCRVAARPGIEFDADVNHRNRMIFNKQNLCSIWRCPRLNRNRGISRRQSQNGQSKKKLQRTNMPKKRVAKQEIHHFFLSNKVKHMPISAANHWALALAFPLSEAAPVSQ
jgi:hypothetical protein